MKKKAIAIIITDTHLNDDNHEENVSVIKETIKLANKLNLTEVEHGGDIFHSRKAQTQRNLNCVGDIFQLFEEAKITLNVAVGNHDKTEYSIANSFLDPYIHHPFVNIYRRGGGRLLTNKIHLSYCSYFSDDIYVDNLTEIIKTLDSKKKNVLLTHIGVNGAVMNNGTVIETKVNASLFEPFDMTLIGHYHDAQQVSSKIKYIGASLQHNFGEGTEKGATILYDDLSIETINFDLPKYRTFSVKATELSMRDVEDLKEAANKTGDKLRVILTGTKAEIDAVDKQRIMVSGIDVTSKAELIEREDVEESIVAFTDITLLEAFSAFCEKNKLEKEIGLVYLKKILC